MSKYTTGEMAKLCEVSVRTVQYYDTRGVLVPSGLSEGGRRLYSDDDLKKLKIICFLRGIGLSLDNIAKVFQDDNSYEVIALLLEQQAQSLKEEMDSHRTKLNTINQLTHELKSWQSFSVETIGDIAFTMKRGKKLRKIHFTMLAVGIFMDVILIGSLLWGLLKGSWWSFAFSAPAAIACGIAITWLYYQKTVYICAECHSVFKPGLREFLFSAHTPKTRKLTCTKCGHKGFCVETFDEEDKDK